MPRMESQTAVPPARRNASARGRLLSPPIKFHGGKHYLAERIIAAMPKHTHYVETHFGGGAVLLRKDYEGISEVANDFHGGLTNFWHVLQDQETFAEFRRIIEATPFSADEFDRAGGDAPAAGSHDVGSAVRFFVRARQSRQGLQRDFATLSQTRTRRGMNEQVSSWLTAVEGLDEVHERLKRVVVLNSDAVPVIRQQDGKATHFYCDPPYVHSTRTAVGAYDYEMTDAQHLALLETLAGIQGTFQLSGYRCKLYDDMAKREKWKRMDIAIDNKASSAKIKETKIESIWMNYKPRKSS